MTTKRPVTHPALHATFNDGHHGGATGSQGDEQPSRALGDGEAVVEAAAVAIWAARCADGMRAVARPDCMAIAQALADAGLLGDDLDGYLNAERESLIHERDDLRARVESLRLIANVNGDWNLKFMQLERERGDLRAKVERVEALADEWEHFAGPESPAWKAYGPQVVGVPLIVGAIRNALDGES